MAGPEIYVIDASAAVEYLLATDTGLQVAELTVAARLHALQVGEAVEKLVSILMDTST